MKNRPLFLAAAAILTCPTVVHPSELVGMPGLTAENYGRRVSSELRENILPFWMKHARDVERGGFHGAIDNDLIVDRAAPRGALLSARVLWTYSAAYRRFREPAYLEMARWAYDDLTARFWDVEHGGLFWSVTADGEPLDDRKIIYVQAFGIYGLSEFHRATGERAALDRALELYRLVERNAHDRDHRGYFEEFTRDWKILRERGQGSAMGSLGQKSQNVHLHLMEAYTNLLRVWPDTGLKSNLREIVGVFRDRILEPSTHHLRLFFDEDWTSRSDAVSFGHDIEFAWLFVETAEVLGDRALIDAAKKEAVEIARVTLCEGVDTDGGVLGEGSPAGITNRFKEWWSQAEAAVGFLNAYQISGDRVFMDASLKSWEFIETKLVDRENGEWLLGVSPDGRIPSAKVSFWKCPYHNGRAGMELVERLEALRSGG